MAYARLDDVFPEHHKVAALSDRAFRAHVRGICYSAKTLSDGFVPLTLGREWGRRATVELEDASLWIPTATGWFIHDYLNYNPSRAEVETKRESQRGQRSAAGKARSAKGQRAAGKFVRNADQPPPLPTPPPVVEVDLDPDTPNAVGKDFADAPSQNGKGKDGTPFHLADVVNLDLVVSLTDRYRRRGWDKTLTPGLLTGLVLGSEEHDLPACGARAVNEAIDDLYANAATTKNPAAYLKERAAELSRSESPQ